MLETDDRLERAFKLAFCYLNRRDRTQAEVWRHLERHDVEARLIENTITALIDQGYLDDARFASLFAQDKRELEQWGGDRIRRTLMQRGIDCELIDQALASEPTETELERALGLLRRRFRSPPRERRERDRALGVLLRKGYNSELALDALATYARDDGRSDSGWS